eukprot:242071_1
MLFDELNYTNAVGAGGFLLSLIAYCIIRRIDIGGQSPSRLYCNARTCNHTKSISFISLDHGSQNDHISLDHAYIFWNNQPQIEDKTRLFFGITNLKSVTKR